MCIQCCTCRLALVTKVRRRTRRATRAGHDVADTCRLWLAGRSAVNLKGVRVTVTQGRPLELELSLWLSWLVDLASAVWVPSQTAGLMSTSLKTRFNAIAKHNKTNCVGRFLIKTFGTAAEEVNQFRRNALRAATSHLWKGRTCFAFQCFGFILIGFLLLGYFCLSIYPLDVAICSINWSRILVNTMTLPTGQEM